MVIDSKFLFSKKIPVGDYFGEAPEAATIELRETSVANAAKFQEATKDIEKTMAHFLALLPGLIVDHDLWKDDVNKYTATEVAEMVSARAELGMHLMGAFTEQVLFTHGKKSDSN
jgi:hypothetical protein